MSEETGKEERSDVPEAVFNALMYFTNDGLSREERRGLHALVAQLRAGSSLERSLAEKIAARFSYPWSDEAVKAGLAIVTGLDTQQGRKAAGLPARRRGPEHSLRQDIHVGTPMGLALLVARGQMSEAEAINEFIYITGDLDVEERTVKKRLRALIPYAQMLLRLAHDFADVTKLSSK